MPSLGSSVRDCLLFVSAAGVVCHGLYHKLEPRRLPWHLMFLVVVPLLTSLLLLPFFSNALWAALAAWSTYLTGLLISTITYRLSPFHPLAKYPGPLICKVTKVWLAKVSWGGKQHLYIQGLHRRYGDIVRIGPNELSFCTPDAIAPVLGANGMPKAAFWDGHFADQTEFRSLVGLRDPQKHAKLRRIWSRGFTSEALRAYQPLLDKRVSQLLDGLTQRAGKCVDLARWISWFSYDLLNDMAFGDGAELMQNEDAGGLWKMMEDSEPTALILAHLPWLAEFYIWIPGIAKKMKDFRAYTIQRVMKRYNDGSAHKDLFYHLMDEAGLESSPPAFGQVASEASLAIVAGSDTIYPVLSDIFWFLLNNDVAYKRLQEEVDKVVLDDVTTQAQLPYLNAVINESMRLFPTVPSGSTRAPLIGSGGHTIGQHFLPEGTTALIHTYTLQRDERNFSPLPDKFIPERWLSEKEQVLLEPGLFKDRKHVVCNTTAFIPFSYGPADCIGKRLALQDMRMVICAILQRFELRFKAGFNVESWEDEMFDYFMVKKANLPVVVTLRMKIRSG
ncbi:hypothetical protein Hypma_002466 [Hypsizygus marmoreus]|uniref:Cytochrome P450 67 n=1 Tax=Hypsizygus marmoreus TaxID=39966 RepID=A0A369J477_HYPMA|nr:hypothetical protein Hypma_002466 [Hypsizygus marmoreus]